jgi:hypothetical protein
MINFTLMPLKRNSQPKARKAGGKVFLIITQSFLEIKTYLKDIKEIHAFIMKSFLLFEEIDKAIEVLKVVTPLLQ